MDVEGCVQHSENPRFRSMMIMMMMIVTMSTVVMVWMEVETVEQCGRWWRCVS